MGNMRKVKIKFVKTHPDAILPQRNHDNRQITPEEKQKITEMQEDYYRQLAIRSGASISDVKLQMQAHQNFYDEETQQVYGTCDSGFDIYACVDAIILPRSKSIVPTGIKVGYIDPGFWFKIEARSGLSFKHGILPHPGIVDGQYRGDTGVCLYNHSDVIYNVKRGDKIAQMVIYPVIDAEISWIDEAEITDRGDKGFGSSGK